MPFEPGVASNPTGRNGKEFKAALRLAVMRADNDKTKLAQIAEALVEKAISGDVPAINAVADRMDGKATQPISGDDEAPQIKVMVEGLRMTLGTKLDRIPNPESAAKPED